VRWLTDPFQLEFMQRALLAGLLAVLATAPVGTWIVIRGMSFIGDALAHGVLPGIALAFLWDVNLSIGALVSAIVMVGLISLVTRRSGLTEDTGIGLLFVGMLALGVVIISSAGDFTGDLSSFLFGNVLGVSAGDLWLQAGAVVLVLLATVLLYRPLLVLAFNRDKAALLGLRPGPTHLAMLALVAVAVVASFQTVGTLMTFGLLVGPPATAVLLVRRVWLTMIVAVALGWVAVGIGLLVSYHWNTAAGATMAGVSVLLFFLVLIATEAIDAVRSRSRRGSPGGGAGQGQPALATS
jgi:manganese/iron transport system permease protein